MIYPGFSLRTHVQLPPKAYTHIQFLNEHAYLEWVPPQMTSEIYTDSVWNKVIIDLFSGPLCLGGIYFKQICILVHLIQSIPHIHREHIPKHSKSIQAKQKFEDLFFQWSCFTGKMKILLYFTKF